MIPVEYGRYFLPTYDIVIFVLTLVAYGSWQSLGARRLIGDNHTNNIAVVIFCLIVSVMLGLRPLTGGYFGDTYTYARKFAEFQRGVRIYDGSGDEWLWDLIMFKSSSLIGIHTFLTIVDLGYFLFTWYGAKRLFRNNAWAAMLFFMGAFSTYAFGTNGIRNGLACSMVFCAISMYFGSRKALWWGVLLCLATAVIHRSILLPVFCFVVALYLKNYKLAVALWFISIGVSLVNHTWAEAFFTQLGFDDRLTNYIEAGEEYARTNKSGFRLDFLIYSAMPIILGWYVIVRRQLADRTFRILCITYVLSNIFWVLMMQASYSSRFAYLSWFLYPMVLAYPCFRLNLWGSRQGHNASNIMLAHVSFTMFMTFVYYGV